MSKEKKISGYIKIFRSVKNHWLWQDEKKMFWWLDILLSANYSDQKVLIKGALVECKRGQSIKSLENWAKDWKTTKKTVRSFLELLKKDEMILIENVKITTRITICNYDSYNNPVNGDDPAEETVTTPHSKRTIHPNNKGNKDNKEKKEEDTTPFKIFSDFVEENYSRVSKMKEVFTEEQYYKLVAEYSPRDIKDVLASMHNYADLLKKNVSANLTFRNWAAKRGIKKIENITEQHSPAFVI